MISHYPMEYDLVKRMNYSLLSLLHTFSQKSSDWEEILCLYTEPPSRHQEGMFTYMKLFFDCNPPSIHVPKLHITAILDYSTNLNQKLLEIRELVDELRTLCTLQNSSNILPWQSTTQVEGGPKHTARQSKLYPCWTGL